VSHNRDDAAAMLREVLAQRSEKISAELIARSFFLPARKSPNVNEPLVFGIERYGKVILKASIIGIRAKSIYL